SETCFYHFDNRFRQRDRGYTRRSDAGGTQDLLEERALLRTDIQNHILISKISGSKVSPCNERMICRHDRHKLILEKRSILQLFVATDVTDDTQIKFPLKQRLNRLMRRLGIDFHLDSGELPPEFLHDVRQPVIAGVALRADPERPLTVCRH